MGPRATDSLPNIRPIPFAVCEKLSRWHASHRPIGLDNIASRWRHTECSCGTLIPTRRTCRECLQEKNQTPDPQQQDFLGRLSLLFVSTTFMRMVASLLHCYSASSPTPHACSIYSTSNGLSIQFKTTSH